MRKNYVKRIITLTRKNAAKIQYNIYIYIYEILQFLSLISKTQTTWLEKIKSMKRKMR